MELARTDIELPPPNGYSVNRVGHTCSCGRVAVLIWLVRTTTGLIECCVRCLPALLIAKVRHQLAVANRPTPLELRIP
jgi:hypothetical protein